MKRLLRAAAVLFAGAVLAACGGAAPEDASAPSESAPIEAGDAQASAPIETPAAPPIDGVGLESGDDADPDRLYAPGTPEFDALATDDFIVEEIKRHEALRLESYVGPSGHILIGYGHLLPDGRLGLRITEAEADQLLREDLREAERFVRLSVTQPIRRREFSALVDFTYNAGVGRLRESEMLRLFNLGDRQGAADAFLTARVEIGPPDDRRVSPALQERRRIARAHFLGVEPF